MSGLSQLFSGLLSILESEEEVKLLPAATNAINTLVASPNLITLQAQGGLLLAQAVAAQPTVLQGGLADLAAVINAVSAKIESQAAATIAKGLVVPTASPPA